MRYCEKCATIRPDRAHHCSVCGTCVLKVALLYFERNASLSFSDGSPLSMGEQLRGIQQLQVFCTLPPLRTPLLPLCCPNQFEVLSSGENRDNIIKIPSLYHSMLQFWRDVGTGQGHGQFHILFLFFVSSMFSISLCSLLGYHIHLVLNNRTTLEAFRL